MLAMTARSRSRKPPSLDLSISSRETSPTYEGAGDSSPDLESDEDLETASTTTNGQRMTKSMFPSVGPYCFKQPTLSEVLSNTAPPPFTLSAFMAYLSQNHCLETLEFTMDASRYRKHYNAVAACHGQQTVPDSKDCAYVRKLWQKLLDAYIVPNGPREVNLPCTIRDKLLSIPNRRTPPPPEALDPAVSIVHELMQESVLVPFLSECQQASSYQPEPPPCRQSHWNRSDENVYMRGSLDERIFRRSHKRSHSPPSPVDFTLPSRTTSPFSASLGWHSSGSRSQPSSSSWDSMMIDDSGSSNSSQWGTPMTPPTTPPMCEAGSPKTRSEKGWKRMTGSLGRGLSFGKKKSEW